MPDSVITPGQVVTLRSGGPLMTVKDVFEGTDKKLQGICSWFNDKNQHEEETFPLCSLQSAEESLKRQQEILNS